MLLFFNASTLPCFKARQGMLQCFYSSMLQRSHASKQEKECSNTSILQCFNAPMLQSKRRNAPMLLFFGLVALMYTIRLKLGLAKPALRH